MHDHTGKELAVQRPVESAKVPASRLLVVSDDRTLDPGSTDSIHLIAELGRQQGRAIETMALGENLSPGWLRQIWSRMVEYGGVHLRLTRTSLLAPSVLALLIVARFFGRPTSVVISGPAADLDGDTLRRHSFVLRLVDKLAVHSPHLLECLRRRGVDGRLLPPIVNDRWFQDRVISRVQPVIIWAGECDEQSHLSVATKAYQTVKQKYPRAELIVVCPAAGSADMPDEMRDMAGIRFVDSRDAEAVVAAYRSADVFLNTSIVDSQPIALLRALATGLPVVTTAVGSLKQLLVNDQSALLLPLDSPVRFADSIIDLVESDDLSSRLSSGASRVAKNYRQDRSRASWRAFLDLDR
jgi:glycosyltransferase involved in cell wall biosynthesis